jgi:phospholipid N-methyltransferase
MTNDTALFVKRFLRHPARVGAVAPSSAALARQAVAPVPDTGGPVVVELGPGTGAFTEVIQRRLAGRGRHLALEVDPVFAGALRRRFPEVDVVVARAERLPEVLALRGLPAADVVISGLPWALFPAAQAARTMAAVAASMAPDAAFTTFAYLHAVWTPAARRLRCDLADTFEEVVLGSPVWANLPAAMVYHARRPRRGHQPAGGTGRKSSPTRPNRWARIPA